MFRCGLGLRCLPSSPFMRGRCDGRKVVAFCLPFHVEMVWAMNLGELVPLFLPLSPQLCQRSDSFLSCHECQGVSPCLSTSGANLPQRACNEQLPDFSLGPLRPRAVRALVAHGARRFGLFGVFGGADEVRAKVAHLRTKRRRKKVAKCSKQQCNAALSTTWPLQWQSAPSNLASKREELDEAIIGPNQSLELGAADRRFPTETIQHAVVCIDSD